MSIEYAPWLLGQSDVTAMQMKCSIKGNSSNSSKLMFTILNKGINRSNGKSQREFPKKSFSVVTKLNSILKFKLRIVF